jgi:predicted homoserine dehydrogenase-like protein
MIIVDSTLRAREAAGNPIRVAMIGAGFMGRAIARQIYTPYHLCHLEAPTSLARAVLFHDAVTAAEFGARVDVVATAKTDLRAGQVLDGIGGYATYGQCENGEVAVGSGCCRWAWPRAAGSGATFRATRC